jgi:hypothetical protein
VRLLVKSPLKTFVIGLLTPATVSHLFEKRYIVKQRLEEAYGYSGWERLAARKKSKLHLDPKVKIINNS